MRKEKKETSGIAYRPLSGTNALTTATPQEHPKDVVYCLSRSKVIVTPDELVEAYPAVYGENSGVDALLIARIPCNASQLLARELRNEKDRNIVIVVYGDQDNEPPLIVRLNNKQKKDLVDFLESNPHQKSVELIDKFLCNE